MQKKILGGPMNWWWWRRHEPESDHSAAGRGKERAPHGNLRELQREGHEQLLVSEEPPEQRPEGEERAACAKTSGTESTDDRWTNV